MFGAFLDRRLVGLMDYAEAADRRFLGLWDFEEAAGCFFSQPSYPKQNHWKSIIIGVRYIFGIVVYGNSAHKK
jgi:hypothetical protein